MIKLQAKYVLHTMIVYHAPIFVQIGNKKYGANNSMCMFDLMTLLLLADEAVDSLKEKKLERDRNKRGTQTTMATAENITRKRQE